MRKQGARFGDFEGAFHVQVVHVINPNFAAGAEGIKALGLR
jgi:hypothetical protein